MCSTAAKLDAVVPTMAKATLPCTRAHWAEIGACLDAARGAARMNLDQLAKALQRDPRQVRRWIAGEEQTQISVVFSVPELRAPFVVALAELAHDDGIEVETVIRVVRRTA